MSHVDAFEVPIAGDQLEIVFQHQRRNPKIIVRDRRPGAFELYKQTRILLGGFARRKQNPDRGFAKESLEQSLVAVLLRASQKSGLHLR